MSVEQYLLLDLLLLPPPKTDKNTSLILRNRYVPGLVHSIIEKGYSSFSLREKSNFLKTMSEKRVKKFPNEKSEKKVTFSPIGTSMVYALTLE